VFHLKLEEIVPIVIDDQIAGIGRRRPGRLSLILRPANALNAGVAGAETLVFETEHPRLTFFFHQGVRIEARVINGNGWVSAWSDKTKVGRR